LEKRDSLFFYGVKIRHHIKTIGGKIAILEASTFKAHNYSGDGNRKCKEYLEKITLVKKV
jgi:hypothetical protein